MFKKYRCHKIVLAKPMTLGDYNIYRDWVIPEDENSNDEGYLVEYLDSPTTGMPHGHINYISWSPKEVFDKGYHEYILGESKSSHSDKCSHPNGGPVGVLTSPSPFDATGNPTLKYFAYEHLPPHLQEVSEPIAALALVMNELPNCPEKSAGMRKLLEAKDCFVRAKLG